MPWLEGNLMDERQRFVARSLNGEKMSMVCGELGISRKTGYILTNFFKLIYYNNRTVNNAEQYDVAHSDQLLLVNPQGEYVGYFSGPVDSEQVAVSLRQVMN